MPAGGDSVFGAPVNLIPEYQILIPFFQAYLVLYSMVGCIAMSCQ